MGCGAQRVIGQRRFGIEDKELGRFDIGRSDRRNIKTHVLARFDDLDEGPAARRTPAAGTLDHTIGALNLLQSDDVLFLDGHGLTNANRPSSLATSRPNSMSLSCKALGLSEVIA